MEVTLQAIDAADVIAARDADSKQLIFAKHYMEVRGPSVIKEVTDYFEQKALGNAAQQKQ